MLLAWLYVTVPPPEEPWWHQRTSHNWFFAAYYAITIAFVAAHLNGLSWSQVSQERLKTRVSLEVFFESMTCHVVHPRLAYKSALHLFDGNTPNL
jgi:hypothetical protein